MQFGRKSDDRPGLACLSRKQRYGCPVPQVRERVLLANLGGGSSQHRFAGDLIPCFGTKLSMISAKERGSGP